MCEFRFIFSTPVWNTTNTFTEQCATYLYWKCNSVSMDVERYFLHVKNHDTWSYVFNFLRHIRFFTNTSPTPTFCTRIVWSNHQLWIISSCIVQNLCVLVKLTLWLLLEHPNFPNPVLSPQSFHPLLTPSMPRWLGFYLLQGQSGIWKMTLLWPLYKQDSVEFPPGNTIHRTGVCLALTLLTLFAHFL